jgi:cation-transporting P-type ATPase 13A2
LDDEDFHMAITGDAFQILLKDHTKEKPNPLFYILLMKCRIYSRMTPEQKMRLIIEYQNIGNYVAMCGDGANDTPSLKAAHVGVSLSQAEASIAAPFTSLIPTIDSVVNVIRFLFLF